MFEKGLSLFILFALAGVGYAVFDKGRNFDPNIFSPDIASLESTREAVEGKAGTLRNEVDLRAYEGSRPPSAKISAAELPAFIPGLTPSGPTEHYVEDTLYEKINGRAPAYIEFSFKKLTARSFMIDSAAGQFIDIYLFRMDSPLNAFGIYSLENDNTGDSLPFVSDGYRSAMGYFFRRGPVYAQVIASDTAPAVMDTAEKMAQALVQSMPANDLGMEARNLLPSYGIKPGSTSYLAQNAYGQAFLKNVFEAKYDQGGVELPYFAMTAATPEEAISAWKKLQAFYERFGSVAETWKNRKRKPGRRRFRSRELRPVRGDLSRRPQHCRRDQCARKQGRPGLCRRAIHRGDPGL